MFRLFCNGPDEVKSSNDHHAAELTFLSMVDAVAAAGRSLAVCLL
jgi:hypothetical protein